MDVAHPLNTERHQHIRLTAVDRARAALSKNITADHQLLVAGPLVPLEDEIAPGSAIAMLPPPPPPPVSTSEISRIDRRKSTAFSPLVHRRSSPPSTVAARATSSLSIATCRGASPQAAGGVQGTNAKSRAAGAMLAPDQQMTRGKPITSSIFSPGFVDLTVDSCRRSLASSAADAAATGPRGVASAVHAMDRRWATGLRASNDRVSAERSAVGGTLNFGTSSDASSKVDSSTKGCNTISGAASAASVSFATALQKGGVRGGPSVVSKVARNGNGRTSGAEVVECRVASGVSAARPAAMKFNAPVNVSSLSHATTPSPSVMAPTTKATANASANRSGAHKNCGPFPSRVSRLGTDGGAADNNTSLSVLNAANVANPSSRNLASSPGEFPVVSFCGGARQTITGRSADVSPKADYGASRSTAPTSGVTAKPPLSAEPRSALVGDPAPLSGKNFAPAAGAAAPGAAFVPTPAPATVTFQPSVVRPPSGMMGAVFPPIPVSKVENTSRAIQSASGTSSSSVSFRGAIGAPTGGDTCNSTRSTESAAPRAPITAVVPSPTQGASTGNTSFAENAAIIEQGRAMANAKFADIRHARAIENRETGAKAPITACLRDEHAIVMAKAKALAKAAFADGRFARDVENGENAARASIESVQRYVKRTNEAAAAAPRTPAAASTEAENTGTSPSDHATATRTIKSPEDVLQAATAQANPRKRSKKEGPVEAAAAETAEGATIPVAGKAVDQSATATSRRHEGEARACGPSGRTSSAEGATGQRVRGGALLSWFGYGKGGGDRS